MQPANIRTQGSEEQKWCTEGARTDRTISEELSKASGHAKMKQIAQPRGTFRRNQQHYNVYAIATKKVHWCRRELKHAQVAGVCQVG